MSLETGTYISDLVATNPTSSDQKAQGDDHVRLIKSTVKTTFPNISGAVTPTHTELNFVDGVTSAIQTQIDTKATKTGATYTGTHDLTGATVTVAAPAVGANPVTKTYADTLAFNTALPAQTVDGTTRLLYSLNGTADYTQIKTVDDTSLIGSGNIAIGGIEMAPIAGGTLTGKKTYSIIANAAYVLPDFTGSSAMGLIFPTNAASVPSSVTTSDGWGIATGASAGTLSMIIPASSGSAHGVWTGQTMTPPTLATITGSANHTILGTAQIDTNLFVVLFRDPTGGGGSDAVFAVAVNTLTNTAGAVATIDTWNSTANAVNSAIFANSTSSFVVGFQRDTASTNRYGVYAASINTGTLAITVGSLAGTPSVVQKQPLIKLANNVYVLSVANTTDLYVVTVSGTVCTVGTGVASGSLTGAFIARSSNASFLAAYCATGGGSNSTRALTTCVYSVSGTVPSANTPSAGSNIYADDIRVLKAYAEGSAYILCCKDGSTSTTGNYHGVTVSGAAATLGAISAQANNLPAVYADTTHTYKPTRAVMKYDSATMLFGHLAAGPFAITISGSTLTVGASGGPATTVNFLLDTATQTIAYGVGSANFDKLSIAGSVITSAFQVAVVPVVIQSDTVTDKAVNYGGTWFSWTLPTMQVALQTGKWLYRSSNNLIYTGPIT